LKDEIKTQTAELHNLKSELEARNSELHGLKGELETENIESEKLKSDNEHHLQLKGSLEQKDNELIAMRQELKLKEILNKELTRDLEIEKGQIKNTVVPDLEKLKIALTSNEITPNEVHEKLHQAALREREGRLKMEASARRAVIIARQAIYRLNEHEKQLLK